MHRHNQIFASRKHMAALFLYCVVVSITLILLLQHTNGKYSEISHAFQKKQILLTKVQTASPAIIVGGRNVAYETGNGVANAPASYLTMLDCCEADEAISFRIAIGQLKCEIIKNKGK